MTEKQAPTCLDCAVLEGMLMHLRNISRSYLEYAYFTLAICSIVKDKGPLWNFWTDCLRFYVHFVGSRVWHYYLYLVSFLYITTLLYLSEINMGKMQLNMKKLCKGIVRVRNFAYIFLKAHYVYIYGLSLYICICRCLVCVYMYIYIFDILINILMGIFEIISM